MAERSSNSSWHAFLLPVVMGGIFLAGSLWLATPAVAQSPALTIKTLAGPGDAADGGLAVDARLRRPHQVVAGPAGELLIADTFRHVIRKVDAAGTITTFAGTGMTGYAGDGGPAAEAQFTSPQGLAVDAFGNVYVADTGNNRVRKIDPLGAIATVAGTGRMGYSGDGGPATAASLHHPEGLEFDSDGNLYIVDGGNSAVRKVDLAGNISTVAGSGASGYGGDGGAATAAQLALPRHVAVDGMGNLFIADQGNHRIRKVDGMGLITTFAGTGDAGFSGDGLSTVCQGGIGCRASSSRAGRMPACRGAR